MEQTKKLNQKNVEENISEGTEKTTKQGEAAAARDE